MANFPTVNSPGDTFHSGSNLYSWTGTAWKIVAGDRPDYGVVTFDPQVFPDTSGIVSLFHLDNAFADASSGGFSSVDGSTSPQYSTTSKWGSHSFDATNTNNRAQFLPPSLTGDFTIECWVRLNNVNANAYHNPIISGPIAGSSNWQHPGFQLMWEGTGYSWMYTHKSLVFHQYNGTNHQSTVTPYSIVGSDIDGSGNPGLEVGVWSHIAVVRQITGSTCTISLYINGIRHKEDTGKEIRDMTFTTHSGTGNHWVVGRMTNNFSNGYHWGTSTGGGQIDEVVVYDEAKYTGSSYTIPTGPASPVTSPPAIAGKSQIYAKDVPNTPPAVLLHFDDNWNNTGSGGNATAVGPPTFEASTVTGTGFNKQIDFNNTAAGTATKYLTFPDPAIGTSAFTFECWFNSDVDAHNQVLFSEGGSTGDGNAHGDVTFTTRIWNTDNKRGFGIWQANTFGNFKYIFWGSNATGDLWTAGQGMKHIALVRGEADAVTAGNSQWRLYLDGNYVAPNTLHNSLLGNLPTVDMGGQAYQVGRIPYVSGGVGYAFDGQMDEIRITKSDTIYTGTGSYLIPTAPFTLPSPTTELYMMDGSGTETKLT